MAKPKWVKAVLYTLWSDAKDAVEDVVRGIRKGRLQRELNARLARLEELVDVEFFESHFDPYPYHERTLHSFDERLGHAAVDFQMQTIRYAYGVVDQVIRVYGIPSEQYRLVADTILTDKEQATIGKNIVGGKDAFWGCMRTEDRRYKIEALLWIYHRSVELGEEVFGGEGHDAVYRGSSASHDVVNARRRLAEQQERVENNVLYQAIQRKRVA
jgi:hypothetical protein